MTYESGHVHVQVWYVFVADKAQVYQTSHMTVEKWVRQSLGEKFKGLEGTRIEVEFIVPASPFDPTTRQAKP